MNTDTEKNDTHINLLYPKCTRLKHFQLSSTMLTVSNTLFSIKKLAQKTESQLFANLKCSMLRFSKVTYLFFSVPVIIQSEFSI